MCINITQSLLGAVFKNDLDLCQIRRAIEEGADVNYQDGVSTDMFYFK